MRTYRVGVVGMGWVAGAHIDALRHVKGAEVAAVCSRRALDPAELRARYGIPLRVYNDYAEMLGDDSLDVIDICTPHPLHPEQASAAAAAGKHLIIEKPVALRFEDAVAMRQAIHQAGVQACVCFEVRFSRQAQATRTAIERGLIGEVHYAEVDYYHGIGPWYGQYQWNVKKDWGGSSLLTAGCHALDLLRCYMPAPIEEISSYQTRSKSSYFGSYEYATTSVSILRFADGRAGKVASCIDCLQPYYFHVHLVGSKGSILDDKFTSLGWDGMQKDRWSHMGVPLVDSGDVKDHPYEPQFQAFFDALQKGEPMPQTDFETAFESHRAVFAADRSAAEGRPVKLAELAVS